MAATTSMLLLLLLVSLMIFCCEARTPSLEEHKEMTKYLKFINSPAAKTITQPAFDHSLLKNHTIQMEPSFFLKNKKDPYSEIARKMGFSDGGCPLGTVPLRRFQMEDLERAGFVSSFTKKQQQTHGLQDNRLSQSEVNEDDESGNWWLVYEESSMGQVEIGY
ncbi:hypothetical protein H6P81_013619 [Aristolochia fimbriata]|uniref:Neprosin activation peptide domain-containing protein n=1 Tax=Aristolochia fimbriata TaxID=158543 RepID=A0AAV7EI28_ARIFI|nr:hypothetical protein H6P81_013619 [Aristolochia fimbriata]